MGADCSGRMTRVTFDLLPRIVQRCRADSTSCSYRLRGCSSHYCAGADSVSRLCTYLRTSLYILHSFGNSLSVTYIDLSSPSSLAFLEGYIIPPLSNCLAPPKPNSPSLPACLLPTPHTSMGVTGSVYSSPSGRRNGRERAGNHIDRPSKPRYSTVARAVPGQRGCR